MIYKVTRRLSKPAFKNESDVKKEIKKIFTTRGWLYWMTPANGFGKAGLPDFFALKDGILIGVEAKFGSNKPTKLQENWMQNLDAAGAWCMVANERNLPEFIEWLEFIGDT